MGERDHYEHGTPCWVDHGSADPPAAAAFYAGLLGWETDETSPPETPGSYLICRLRGRVVAAIGSQAIDGAPPMWNHYVAVEDADAVALAAERTGGSVLAGPFDVVGAGRMAVLRDPGGAIVSVWQSGARHGAELLDEPGALAWNELATRDVAGAQAFYAVAFGWRAVERSYGGGRYVTWHLAGDGSPAPAEESAIGGLMPMEGDSWPAALPAHWMAYFAVEDADASAKRALALGGAVSVAPFDTDAGRIAVLSDPVGAVVSLIQSPRA